MSQHTNARYLFGQRLKFGHAKKTQWGLNLREPFTDQRLANLSEEPHTDETGETNLVTKVCNWPLDCESRNLLLETINDLNDIGVIGHLTPVILENHPTENMAERYSFSRIVRNDGVAVRIRRFMSDEREFAQYGFIDEDGKERVVVGHKDAKFAYMSAISHNVQNPEDSIESGHLVVLNKSGEEDRSRLDGAAGRLARAGIIGLLTLMRDEPDFSSGEYERRHVMLQLKTQKDKKLLYREDFVDDVLVRRTVSNGYERRTFDDHHVDLCSGASNERELYRRLFNEISASAISST